MSVRRVALEVRQCPDPSTHKFHIWHKESGGTVNVSLVAGKFYQYLWCHGTEEVLNG